MRLLYYSHLLIDLSSSLFSPHSLSRKHDYAEVTFFFSQKLKKEVYSEFLISNYDILSSRTYIDIIIIDSSFCRMWSLSIQKECYGFIPQNA
jgi:hypothetical protein